MLKHYLRVYYNYKQNNWLKLLLMTTFAYNNNVHLNIDCAFNEFLKNYVADFANEFKNKFIKKKTFLIIEKQNDCEVTKSTCENYKKKLRKNKS